MVDSFAGQADSLVAEQTAWVVNIVVDPDMQFVAQALDIVEVVDMVVKVDVVVADTAVVADTTEFVWYSGYFEELHIYLRMVYKPQHFSLVEVDTIEVFPYLAMV